MCDFWVCQWRYKSKKKPGKINKLTRLFQVNRNLSAYFKHFESHKARRNLNFSFFACFFT